MDNPEDVAALRSQLQSRAKEASVNLKRRFGTARLISALRRRTGYRGRIARYLSWALLGTLAYFAWLPCKSILLTGTAFAESQKDWRPIWKTVHVYFEGLWGVLIILAMALTFALVTKWAAETIVGLLWTRQKLVFSAGRVVGFHAGQEYPIEAVCVGQGNGRFGFMYKTFRGFTKNTSVGDLLGFITDRSTGKFVGVIYFEYSGRLSFDRWPDATPFDDLLPPLDKRGLSLLEEISNDITLFESNVQLLETGLRVRQTPPVAPKNSDAPIGPKARKDTNEANDRSPATTVSDNKNAKPQIDPFAELDQQIGLQSVKDQVREIYDNLRANELRRAKGIKVEAQSLHFVFTGKPGTGKTTIARIVARLLHQIGALPTDKLVEVDRSQLVAQYIGQTAPTTTKKIEEAMGGVLFIDEAYSLAPPGNTNDFGKEAIEALLKRMEDDRGKFIVIVAGYKNKMDEFIDSNAGLKSRFTLYLDFPDYSPSELADIFTLITKGRNYVLELDAQAALVPLCERMVQTTPPEKFGNGRDVRGRFEKAERAQGRRLISDPNADPMKLTLADINAGFEV